MPSLVGSEMCIRDRPMDNEFVLDAVWFRRYAVVTPEAAAPALLSSLADLIESRRRLGASARHTLIIAWDLPDLPPNGPLRRLADAARETNVRLMVWLGAGRPVPDVTFDQVVAAADFRGDAPDTAHGKRPGC